MLSRVTTTHETRTIENCSCVVIDLGDGYVLTVTKREDRHDIDLAYPDGEDLTLESILFAHKVNEVDTGG